MYTSTPVGIKTGHFTERQRQRLIPDDRIALALRWGQCFYQGDDRVFFLGRKQLARAQRQMGTAWSDETVRKTDGTVVVVAGDGVLVTTYRNPKHIRHLRRCDA